MVTFRPDGRASRGRVGLLVPHFDPVAETETRQLLPGDVSLHVARVPLGLIAPGARLILHVGRDAALSFARNPALRSAAARLAALDTSVTIYSFTSSSFMLSAQEESGLAGMLSEILGGVPVILQARALIDALAALEVGRVALIQPPWVKPELLDLGTAYFERNGVAVLDHARADVARELGEVSARALFTWVRARVPDEAEAVVICASTLRAIGIVEALEEALGRPVVTANQAAAWSALNQIGVRDPLEGYGRLFDCEA